MKQGGHALKLDNLVEGAVRATATQVDVNETLTSFLDTLAVTHAGWNEPVVRALRSYYGDSPESAEQRAILNATAAHALDFDDLQFSSLAHVSAVVIPAIVAVMDRPDAEDIAGAYSAGVNVARWIGAALGAEHYSAGWHATSTIGPMAAAAAVGRMWKLTDRQMRHAIALATCQSAGTQRSFGSMAKPLHAGFAAGAGVRAAELARLGVTGPTEPFGNGGFEALYSGKENPAATDYSRRILDLARKAYPCCYCAQRLVSAAIDLRSRLDDMDISEIREVTVTAQKGTLIPLVITQPKDGNEAKFCADYLIAAALIDGRLGLEHFKMESLHRKDIHELRSKVRVVEEGAEADSIEDGVVQASCVFEDGRQVDSSIIRHFPGSLEEPLTAQQLNDKLLSCFAGDAVAVSQLTEKVKGWLGVCV